MDRKQLESTLLDFIVDAFLVERDEIPKDNSLIDEGIIDSFGLIEITSFLENYFSILIDEEELIRENFGSFNKTIDFLEKKLSTS